MFAQIAYPDILAPEELDKYLEMGWFRMRQTIFTTNFLHFGQRFYSAIWLRVALNESIYDKKFAALSKQNRHFDVDIKKAGPRVVTQQQELLYSCYRNFISFEVSPTLQELLIGNQPYNRFDTHYINIYDGSNLIAAGFFDIGKTGAAGISCIYHPDYKKYSLGKYLMYLKMDFCRQRQLRYFYPGYTVPGYKSFDYKMDVGKTSLQYLQLSSQTWLACDNLITDPLQEMCKRLTILHTCLGRNSVPASIQHYQFFEANLDPYYHGNALLDFPVFLYCFPLMDTDDHTIIVYDMRDQKYHLLRCGSVINIGFHPDARPVFDTDLLRVEQELFATDNPQRMCDFLSGQ